MSANRRPNGLRSALISFGAALLAAACACSSSGPTASGPPGLVCSPSGVATPGAADTHCMGQPVQTVNYASCFPDAESGGSDDSASAEGGDDSASGDGGAAPGDDSGGGDDDSCEYGATMFGSTGGGDSGPIVNQGDDDDCKYHIEWTSTPICRSSTLGVVFTVTVTNLATGLPVTDIPAAEGVLPEAFVPTTLDAACDTLTTHPSPTSFGDAHFFQTAATSGIYQGQIIFDQSGEWTVRFHIHEECSDARPDSPHGHAAFHITVP